MVDKNRSDKAADGDFEVAADDDFADVRHHTEQSLKKVFDDEPDVYQTNS